MVQHTAMLTMADQEKVIYDLLNGAVFNDLEQPLTQLSRSRYSLTLHISLAVKDTALLWKANRKLHPSFRMVAV